MKLHIGSEIKKKLEEKGITPEWLAQKISTSRRNLYDILTREEVSTGQLQEISEALKFDFFSLYQSSLDGMEVNEPSMIYKMPPKKLPTVSISIELDGTATTLNRWIATLEKLNTALA